MSFLDKFTPSSYRLTSLKITRDIGLGEIYASFEFELFGSNGNSMTHADYTVTLEQSEISVLAGFVNSKLSEFEAETGLVSG